MKKILFALAFVLCAASVSAQGWGLGARIGSGFQAQAEYTFSSNNYLEGRVGLGGLFDNHLGLDVTAIYQWNIGQWDWTPKAGTWFFDAGVGASGGFWNAADKINNEIDGASVHYNYGYLGVTGCAKFGIKFNGAPVKLAIDYSPTIGPWFGHKDSGFRTSGFYNFCLSCVYCF